MGPSLGLLLLLALIVSGRSGFARAEPDHPLVVGTRIGFPPYADVDSQGRPTGFAVELFSAVAAAMDIPVSYRPGHWDSVWESLKKGELDALPMVAHMAEREGQVEFTRPHTIGYDSFFVRRGRPPIEFIEQARALSVIVQRSDTAHLALAGRGFTHQLVVVDSMADGFRLLASGQHDAVLAPQLQGNMLLKRSGLGGVVEPGPLLKEYRREYCFAVRKGDTELRDRLDRGLAIVKASGEYDRLYRKWLGIYDRPGFPVEEVAWGAGTGAALLAVLCLWNWTLRRQVARRTAELAEAAAAVRAERRRLHDVLQTLPVYVVLLTPDHQVSFANRFFEERYGKAQGRRCFEYLFKRNRPCEVCETFKVLETQAPVKWAWTGPDGHDYEIYNYPFADIDGSPMIMEVGIDVTEMNRARQALREANLSLERRVAERTAELEAMQQEAERARDLLQITMDNVPALMSYVDAECRYRRVNRVYEQWFGRTEEQVVGQHMRDVVGEGAWAAIGHYVDRALAGETVSFDLYAPYAEGGTRWVQATYLPDRSGDGRVRGFVVHVLDITARKTAEQALEAARAAAVLEHERLQAVMQALPVGVAIVDAGGGRVDANAAFEQIWGGNCPAVDTVSDYAQFQAWWTATGEPVQPEDWASARAVEHGESVVGQMLRIRRFNGTHAFILNSAVPIRDAAGHITGGAVAIQDISAQKHAEDLLRESDRRKDEFLAMLAHELRNPLVPIQNAGYILKLPGLDAARLAWCGDVIGRQVEQLTRMVDDLLDVSRISRGKIELRKEHLLLADIVQRAVETSRPLIEARRHEFSVRLPAQPVRLDGDLVRLAQVVSNLLNNAAKYTDEAGRIELAVEQSDSEAVIRVRDNGRGIDPSALADLFDMFYQVDRTIDRAEGGLGIGLSLVRNLVEMHGGVVQAFSAGRGHGSEFVVRLPCLPEQPAVPVPQPERPEPAAGGRVLVVDDNHDVADSLALLLSIEGHEVLIAHDGQTALDIAQAKRPRAVVLDIGLPGMDGYAVAQALRQCSELKTVRLIALSGYGQEKDREKARTAGFDSYLTKPVDLHELQSVLAVHRTSS